MSAPSAPSDSTQVSSTQPNDNRPSKAQFNELLKLLSSSIRATEFSHAFFSDLTEQPLNSSSDHTKVYSANIFEKFSKFETVLNVSGGATNLFTRLAGLEVAERPEEDEFYVDVSNVSSDSKHIDFEVQQQVKDAKSSYKYMLELIMTIDTTHVRLMDEVTNLGCAVQEAADEDTKMWPTPDDKEVASTVLQLTRDLVSSVARFRFAGGMTGAFPQSRD